MGLTPRPTPIFPWVEESEVRKLFCSRIQHRSSSRGLEVEFLHRFSNLVLTVVIGKVISKKNHFLRFNFFTKLPFDSWLDSLEAFVNCRLNYLLNLFVCSKDKRFINRFIKFSTSAVDIYGKYRLLHGWWVRTIFIHELWGIANERASLRASEGLG